MPKVRKRKVKRSSDSDSSRKPTPEEEEQGQKFLLVTGTIFAIIVVMFFILEYAL